MLQNGVLTQLDDVKERKGNHGSNEYQHNVCVVENHARQKCSATRDATCGKCNKSGHFAKVFAKESRRYHPKGQDKNDQDNDGFFLGEIKSIKGKYIKVNGVTLTFKLDAVAEVTVKGPVTKRSCLRGVKNLETQLLGRSACLALDPVPKVGAVSEIAEGIKKRFPKLFSGLGCIWRANMRLK